VSNEIAVIGQQTQFVPSPDPAHEQESQGGVYIVKASFPNKSAKGFTNVRFVVTRLDGPACPCVLLNADGSPGGAGSTLSVQDSALPGGDGIWGPGEKLNDVEFRIGLTAPSEFTLFVEVIAVETGG
jgi:hypothetical protein